MAGVEGFITDMGASVVGPFMGIWNGIVGIVPGIVGAIIVLILGYLVALLFGFIVRHILEQFKIDLFLAKRFHVTKLIGNLDLSHFLSLITRWYTFILFFPPAANLVRLTPLSDFLTIINLWIPNLILGIIIVMLGIYAGQYVSDRINEFKLRSGRTLASAARVVVILLTSLVALRQASVDITIAEHSFLIVLGGVVFAIALAFGISFGAALKPYADTVVKDVNKKW